MAVVRELIAKFGVRTDPTGFRKGEQGLQKLIRGAKLLAGAVVAGRATKALLNITAQTAALGDRLDKVSQQLGVNAQALQELEFAANLAGASNQDLSVALRTLARNALEAQQGSKEFAQDFQRLGVRVTDVNGRLKPAEQLLEELAGGFQRLTSDTERTALAQSLLGRSGSRLIPLLKQGSAAISEQRQEARELGLLDKELIALSVEFTDNQRRVAGVLQGVRNVIAKFFLPSFIKMQKATVAWFKANRQVIAQKLKFVFQKIGDTIRRLSNFTSRVVKAFHDWLKSMPAISKQLLTISAIAIGLAVALLLPGGPLLLMLALIGLLIDDFEVWRKGGKSVIGDLLGSFTKFEAKIDALRERFGGVVDVVKFVSDRTQEIMFSLVQFIIDIFDKGPIEAVLNLGRNLKMVGDNMFGWLVAPAQEAADFLKTLFQDLWNFISQGFIDLFKSNVEAVKDIGRLIGGIFGGETLGAVSPVARIATPIGAIARAGAAGGIAVPGPTARPIGGASIINAPTNRIEVNVKAGPGMNEAALADLTARKIDQALARQNRTTIQAITPVLP